MDRENRHFERLAEAPIHFKEIKEIGEEKLASDSDRYLLMFPKKEKQILEKFDQQENKKQLEKDLESEKANLKDILD